MNRPGVGIGIFAFNTTNKKLLIGKRIKGKSWGLPGGKLEHGEEFIQSAIRELKEETNIDIEDEARVDHVCSFNCVNTDDNYHWFDVYVRVLLNDNEESQLFNNEPDKCEKWEWFSYEELIEKYEELFYPLKVFLKKYNIKSYDDILSLNTV